MNFEKQYYFLSTSKDVSVKIYIQVWLRHGQQDRMLFLRIRVLRNSYRSCNLAYANESMLHAAVFHSASAIFC